MIDEIAYRNNPPPPPPPSKKRKSDDFSDWPFKDVNNKFSRISKHQRNKLVPGFYAGPENENEKYSGAFQTNTVDPYPAVKPMGLTRLGDKQSLYTTGDLEHDTASGISSAVIRGDTDDMSVPNLEGTDFDNVRHSKKYGTPYVPLTQQEKEQLISQVDTDRRVTNITGEFVNTQSAGKSRRRTRKGRRRSKTHKKRRSKKSTKKKRVKRVKKTRRKRGGSDIY